MDLTNKKPLLIAVTAIVLLAIIGLTVSLILVCTLNTTGAKVFELKTFDVDSAVVSSVSPDGNGENKEVTLSEELTSALVNVLNASAMRLTVKKGFSAVYSVTLTMTNGKTMTLKASGEHIYFDGKIYKTNGSVCNFLGYAVYGSL